MRLITFTRESVTYPMHSICRALASAILAFTLCVAVRAQTFPITPLNPSVIQPIAAVTTDTSTPGALRITYAGVSGSISMDLPKTLSAFPFSSGAIETKS